MLCHKLGLDRVVIALWGSAECNHVFYFDFYFPVQEQLISLVNDDHRCFIFLDDLAFVSEAHERELLALQQPLHFKQVLSVAV